LARQDFLADFKIFHSVRPRDEARIFRTKPKICSPQKQRRNSAMGERKQGTILTEFGGAVRKVSRISFYIGSGLLFVIMILVTVDVTGRFFFNRPLLGSLEITEFLLAGAVLLGLAYTQDLRGNVDLELIYKLFPGRLQRFCDILAYIIGIGLFAVVTWEGAVNAFEGWGKNLASDVLRIPAWPFLLFVPVGACLLVLVLFCQLCESFGKSSGVEETPES
jgi:TRAP-type transport system small permease protein